VTPLKRVATVLSEYKPPSFSWNVSEADQPGAYDHYRDSFTDLYDVVDAHGPGRNNFTSRTSLTLFRAGVIAHGRSTAQTLIRTPERIRRSGIDSVNLTLVNGSMVGDSNGRNVSTAGGTVHLQDMSRPSRSRWRRLDIINLTIPRERVAHLLAETDIHGTVIDSEFDSHRLIAHHLNVFSHIAPSLTEEEGEAAITAALLIVERGLGRESIASAAQTQAIYRTVHETAVRFISRHLLAPDLNVATIARACAVSRATLYRAFDNHGGVAAQIQRMRLDRARQALRSRFDGVPTITDIAFDYGFSSQGHFSRAYRARFGYSPSDEPSLWGEQRAGMRLPLGEIQHDRVADWLRSGL
jgi:AraC-like DNA-binding protein